MLLSLWQQTYLAMLLLFANNTKLFLFQTLIHNYIHYCHNYWLQCFEYFRHCFISFEILCLWFCDHISFDSKQSANKQICWQNWYLKSNDIIVFLKLPIDQFNCHHQHRDYLQPIQFYYFKGSCIDIESFSTDNMKETDMFNSLYPNCPYVGYKCHCWMILSWTKSLQAYMLYSERCLYTLLYNKQ